MKRRLFFQRLASGLLATTSAGLFLPKLIKPRWSQHESMLVNFGPDFVMGDDQQVSIGVSAQDFNGLIRPLMGSLSWETSDPSVIGISDVSSPAKIWAVAGRPGFVHIAVRYASILAPDEPILLKDLVIEVKKSPRAPFNLDTEITFHADAQV